MDGHWKGEELMSNSIFSEHMTSNQARTALFSAVDGKTKAEIEKLKAEYSKILPKIMKRELALASKGWSIG